MSPSSIFSRGSLSPFVFCPSKISRSRQNQVTVLSWGRLLLTTSKIFLWCLKTSWRFKILTLPKNYDCFGYSFCFLAEMQALWLCHLISRLPLWHQHKHGVDHGMAKPGTNIIFILDLSSQHLNAAEAKLLMMSGWTPALYSVASSTSRPYLAEMGVTKKHWSLKNDQRSSGGTLRQ